jgi:hypothetical protein
MRGLPAALYAGDAVTSGEIQKFQDEHQSDRRAVQQRLAERKNLSRSLVCANQAH